MSDTARRVPQLDGIRGTAILFVVIWHFVVVPIQEAPQEGILAHFVAHVGVLTWSGVDLFFVLSGLLIGGILIDAKESPNFFRTFYIRRAFRILPVYLLLVSVYWGFWSLATTHQTAIREVVGGPMPWYIYFTFTQNFWLAHHGWNAVFLTLSWSLAVEEQFYILLPVIVRLMPRQLLLLTAATLALGSAITRTLLYLRYGPSWGNAAYVLLLSRADSLMIGVICAALLRDRNLKELLVKKLWAIRAFALILAFGIAIFIYMDWGMGTVPMCTVGFTCLALFYASVLVITMIAPEGFLSRVFRERWLMGLGTIAYGLYLIHEIVLTSLFHILRHHPPSMTSWLDVATACCAFIAAIGFSKLSWLYFECKLVRLGHRFAHEGRIAAHSSMPLSVASAEK